MKRKFEWGAVVFTVCFIFIIRFGFLEGPAQFVYVDLFSRSPVKNNPYNARLSKQITNQPPPSPLEQTSSFDPPSNLSSPQTSLGAWDGLKLILTRSDLPLAVEESFKEGLLAWQRFLPLVDEGRHESTKDDKLCLDSAGSSNATEHTMALPCGLILDSSVTVVATPLLGATEFQIELIGANAPGESGPPAVILHYNVRIQGDSVTDQPVIIQNTWTSTSDWGEEERCPSPEELKPSQVDGLDRCDEQVGTVLTWKPPPGKDGGASSWASKKPGSRKTKPWFPYVEGMPFAATIWAGWEGFHVTINGKHSSSFQYREGHDPSVVGMVEVQGGLRLASIFATGLPMSENMAGVLGSEYLKAPPLPPKSKKLALFIGVFSSSSNFDQRMAQRKSWMQFDAVRSGAAAVRFFVGLHMQEQVNKELWEEAKIFGDLQLLPFVDYYHLITLKTAAICIYVTEYLEVDYVMKTDDDTFVRVDRVLSLLQKRESNQSCVLGDVEKDSSPYRDKNSKWYISPEEWPQFKYPPFAHGPAYIISSDIAKFISKVSTSPQLKLFKLEDVSMGIWIDEFRRSQIQSVEYIHNDKFISGGCEPDYVTAHYQTPRQMLCLWNQLRAYRKAVCCS